jgi:hypothetical protein
MGQKDGTAGQQCVARREAEGMAERGRVECVDIATAVPQLADNFIHRTSRQNRADIVAKGFWVSEEAILIQDQPAIRKVD